MLQVYLKASSSNNFNFILYNKYPGVRVTTAAMEHKPELRAKNVLQLLNIHLTLTPNPKANRSEHLSTEHNLQLPFLFAVHSTEF